MVDYPWDPNISLADARRLCAALTRRMAREVRNTVSVMGEPSVAGGSHRLAIGACGAPEVQRREGGACVSDMGDEPVPPYQSRLARGTRRW
jgi:hypothetical protein